MSGKNLEKINITKLKDDKCNTKIDMIVGVLVTAFLLGMGSYFYNESKTSEYPRDMKKLAAVSWIASAVGACWVPSGIKQYRNAKNALDRATEKANEKQI